MQTYSDGSNKVEAVQLTASNAKQVAEWCGGDIVTEHDALQHEKTNVGINFDSATGRARVSEGQYLIKNADGEFFRRDANHFELYYNETEADDDSLS